MIGLFGGGDEEGVVSIMGNMFDPLGIEDFLDDRRKFLEVCGARRNSKRNAPFVEVKSHEFHPQIVMILGVYSEETECVFNVNLGEETGGADFGDRPKNVLKTDIFAGNGEETGIDTVFGLSSGVGEVMDDSQLLGAFLWDGAERRDLEIREGGRDEGSRCPSHLNFFLKRLKDFQCLRGIVEGMMKLCGRMVPTFTYGRWNGEGCVDSEGKAAAKPMEEGCADL